MTFILGCEMVKKKAEDMINQVENVVFLAAVLCSKDDTFNHFIYEKKMFCGLEGVE